MTSGGPCHTHTPPMSQRKAGSQRPAQHQQQQQQQREDAGAARQRQARQAGSAVQAVHRMALVQALMSRSYMRESECKSLLRRMCDCDDAAYTETITAISMELQFAHLAVLSVLSPVDNVKYVGLVNQLADDSAKVATQYSIPQRDYFRAVMEAIAVAPDDLPRGDGAPCLSEMELLNLDPAPGPAASQPQASQAAGGGGGGAAAASKKLKMHEKQDVLHRLVADGWLESPQEPPGHYSLGPRTFLELKEHLKSLELPDRTRDAWSEVI